MFSVLATEVEDEASLVVVCGVSQALEGVLPQLLLAALVVEEEAVLEVHRQHTRTAPPDHISNTQQHLNSIQQKIEKKHTT